MTVEQANQWTKMGVVAQVVGVIGTCITLVWIASAQFADIKTQLKDIRQGQFTKHDADTLVFYANQRGNFPLPYTPEYLRDPETGNQQ